MTVLIVFRPGKTNFTARVIGFSVESTIKDCHNPENLVFSEFHQDLVTDSTENAITLAVKLILPGRNTIRTVMFAADFASECDEWP